MHKDIKALVQTLIRQWLFGHQIENVSSIKVYERMGGSVGDMGIETRFEIEQNSETYTGYTHPYSKPKPEWIADLHKYLELSDYTYKNID